MESSIIDRIRKLLALAANNPEPMEAERAAALANKLMLEHSISEERVNASKPDDLRNFVSVKHTTGKFASWEVSLLCYIANANLCRVIKLGRDLFDVLGPKENVAVTIEMQGWLRDEIHRLTREAYAKKDEHSSFGAMDPHRFHTSFKHGAVGAVGHRLHKQKEEVTHSVTESTAQRFDNPVKPLSNASALMLISTKVEKFVEQQYPKLNKGKASKAGTKASSTAFRAGHKVGANIALKPTKQIGGGK